MAAKVPDVGCYGCGYPQKKILQDGEEIWVCDCPLKGQGIVAPNDFHYPQRETQRISEETQKNLHAEFGLSPKSSKQQNPAETFRELPRIPISIYATLYKDRAVGVPGIIPWGYDSYENLIRIRKNAAILMGRKTCELLSGDSLGGDDNFVLTNQPDFKCEKYIAVSNIADVLALQAHSEIIIVGGHSLFKLFFWVASKLYLDHRTDELPEANMEFPPIVKSEWRLLSKDFEGRIRHIELERNLT